MLTILRRAYDLVRSTKRARVLVQALVSLVLVVLLAVIAQRTGVFDLLKDIPPGVLVLAAGFYVAASVVCAIRWKLLLQHVDVHEGLGSLTALYLIGQFFSLFLPTAAGGDAARIFEVARRHKRPVPVFLATLQERMIGFATQILIGVAATFYFLALLAPELRPWLIVTQVAMVVGLLLLIYPALLFGSAKRVAKRVRPLEIMVRRVVSHRIGARLLRILRIMAALPYLSPVLLTTAVTLSAATAVLNIAMFYVIGQSLDIDIGFLAYCLVFPLVTIVRMLPISLNGIGVGEGAFVFLMELFGVSSKKSLALAVSMLGVTILVALAGGVVLALRVASGTWISMRQPKDGPVEPIGHLLPQEVPDAHSAVGEKTSRTISDISFS
jgi:uncharacterized protein (TIRG00374 family)